MSQNGGLAKVELKNRCQVEVFGRRYTLRSDADEAYAQELAAFVNQKMTELAGGTKTVDFSKVAVFAALNIAHEFFQATKQQKESEAMINRKTRDLIDSIEEQFEEFKPA